MCIGGQEIAAIFERVDPSPGAQGRADLSQRER